MLRIKREIQKRRADGFTLIEMLIIAPIVIIMISGFIALMISMVGDVLTTRDQSSMTFETQDALDRIEQDTRLTTQFLATSGVFPSPQGSNNNFTGTAAFTSANSLILGGLTTTKNPADSTKQLVYYANQPNDCGPQESYNRIFQGKIMYFVKDNALWRRVVLPNYNTNATVDDSTVCDPPWQQNTCSPGYSGSTRCQTNDSKIMDNVTSFSVKYYTTPNSTTDIGPSQALSASTIEVTINGAKTTAGKPVNSSGSIRATKLNSIDVDLPLPGTPVVTGQSTNNNQTATFSWSLVPSATSYLIQYNINGGSWQNATVDNRTSSYNVSAYRNDTVSIRVAANNSTGTSTYGLATTTMGSWLVCPLQNGWVDYGAGYASSGFTKTSNEVVYFKGLIKSGTVTSGTVLCTLPVGYRPTDVLVFLTGTSGSPEGAPARIDVYPNGNVTVNYGTNTGWIDLDMIRFVASTAPYTWTDLALTNSWVNYGGQYANMRSTIDGSGRVQVQGLLKSGTATPSGTPAATLPVGQRPSNSYILPSASTTAFNSYQASTTAISTRGIAGNGYWSIQGSFFPSAYSNWTALTLKNSWVVYSATFTPPSYTKTADNVVTVRGLIKSGTVTAGTVLATLPPGYRPAERQIYTGNALDAYSRIDVLPTGDIQLRAGSASFTSLDSITFIAEQ